MAGLVGPLEEFAMPGFLPFAMLVLFGANAFGQTRAVKQARRATYPDRPATVLLVTDRGYFEAWRPFVKWKTRQGKATKMVDVRDIEQFYKGADIQEKIRTCILYHVSKHGTRWVILGGDSVPGVGSIVPDRDTSHSGPRQNYTDIPTDIYYISEKDWDSNEDGIYGDWSKDMQEVDYGSTKACIGRIPVRTPDDVKAYTEKVIAYESRYPSAEFARKLVYTCPEKHAYPKLNTSKNILSQEWENGEILQFFALKTPWDGALNGDHDLTPANWAKMINDKVAGKLHMHGHGFLPQWILERNQTVEKKHVDELTNEDAYLLMSTVSCFTGQYDSKLDPSIVESMLRKPKGGAVAVVAPSREGVAVFHNPKRDMSLMITQGKMDATTELITRFWKEGLVNKLTTGEALQAAKLALAEDAARTPGYHFVLCELNLLGDPTLDFRSGDPVTPKFKLPGPIAIGKSRVKLATEVPGATVCFWKGNECYQVVKTDARGKVSVDVDCKTAGHLLVTVSGPNINTYKGRIKVR